MKSYIDRIYKSKIICGKMRDFKFRIFCQLYNLAVLSNAHPRDPLNTDGMGGGAPIPLVERRAKYAVRRLALLNLCRDPDELRFLDYYARDGADILADIEAGYWHRDFATQTLNRALLDICEAIKKGEKNEN